MAAKRSAHALVRTRYIQLCCIVEEVAKATLVPLKEINRPASKAQGDRPFQQRGFFFIHRRDAVTHGAYPGSNAPLDE